LRKFLIIHLQVYSFRRNASVFMPFYSVFTLFA
jgi:hypothetical protein